MPAWQASGSAPFAARGLDYIAAFFGCLYAKAVAVPAYPRCRTAGLTVPPRVILADALPAAALTSEAILAQVTEI